MMTTRARGERRSRADAALQQQGKSDQDAQGDAGKHET